MGFQHLPPDYGCTQTTYQAECLAYHLRPLSHYSLYESQCVPLPITHSTCLSNKIFSHLRTMPREVFFNPPVASSFHQGKVAPPLPYLWLETNIPVMCATIDQQPNKIKKNVAWSDQLEVDTSSFPTYSAK